MNRRKIAWLLRIAGLVGLALILTGCDPTAASTSNQVDPPATSLSDQNDQISQTLPSTDGGGSSPLSTATEETPLTPIPTQITDHDVLTESQKDRLYSASREYLADTVAETVRVISGMLFVNSVGYPTNISGPLSIAILRDAGLVDRYTDLQNFWLLNPRDNFTEELILEKTFPPDRYLWFRTSTPINQFDFEEFPLYSGDFLYLYAGGQGTFEHMITVSRVDEQGRAYAITAEPENGSYLIRELMLYNPQKPGEGYFYDIADNEYSETLGTTSFGGFQLWRPSAPIPDPSLEEAAFHNQMDLLFENYGGEWHLIVKEVDGRVLYALGAHELIQSASVVKVPLAMLFMESLHERQVVDLRMFLIEQGTDGRSYKQLLSGMLVDSEEEATISLLDDTDNYLNPTLTLREWGYQNTTIISRWTTVREITRLFEDLWMGRVLSEEETTIILKLMAVYTTEDENRLGVIRDEMPPGAQIYTKRASVGIGDIVVGEVAILELGSQVYIVSIFGYPGNEDIPLSYNDLEQAIEDAAWVIWGYIQ